jgi:nitroreductase/Pyruvate/2-oxoacid:ferredoxin oxidoreductase delta subunit
MSRLKILGIDAEKCIKCEDCILSCSPILFQVIKNEKMEKKIIFDDKYHRCFRCGHCLVICPTDAILYEGSEPPEFFEEAKHPEKILSFDDLMKLIRSRKSIRVFKDEPVPKEKIEAILEAMRYSPSASNRQNREYIVITDKEKIASLSKDVGSMMLTVGKLLKFKYLLAPFVTGVLRRRLLNPRTKYSLDMYIERTKKGDDLMFFKAPCVIILHAPLYSRMSAADAGIAITHGMFAALSLGLGTCWIGFAHEYLSRFKKARRKLGVPKRNDVFGVFIVGYPDLEFLGGAPRRPLKVQWME